MANPPRPNTSPSSKRSASTVPGGKGCGSMVVVSRFESAACLTMDSVLNLLVLAALTPIAYNFPVGVKRSYDLEATFDGYVPFLGGRQATVQVTMGLDVQGLAPDEEKRLRAQSELTAVKLVYNGATMPMELKNVQTYF